MTARSDDERAAACRTAATREPRVCEVCGATYAPTAPNQKYCSAKCSRRHERRQERERDRASAPEAAPRVVECAICGRHFELRGHHRVYCSAECSRLGQLRKISQRRSHAKSRRTPAPDIVHADSAPRRVVRCKSSRTGFTVRVEYRGTCAAGPRSANNAEMIRSWITP